MPRVGSSIPKIRFIVLDVVSLEELDELLGKGSSCVVFLLVIDVVEHLRDRRLTDREGPVAGLPGKFPQPGLVFMEPAGRVGFDVANGIGD